MSRQILRLLVRRVGLAVPVVHSSPVGRNYLKAFPFYGRFELRLYAIYAAPCPLHTYRYVRLCGCVCAVRLEMPTCVCVCVRLMVDDDRTDIIVCAYKFLFVSAKYQDGNDYYRLRLRRWICACTFSMISNLFEWPFLIPHTYANDESQNVCIDA